MKTQNIAHSLLIIIHYPIELRILRYFSQVVAVKISHHTN